MKDSVETLLNEVVTEPSTNPHIVKGPGLKVVKNFDSGEMYLDCEQGKIIHGEHGSMFTRGGTHKFNQTEVNPITGMIMKAVD